MRLVTWNCNLRLSRKLERLLELDPDVAIIQECEKELQCPSGYEYTWRGNNPSKGLGILYRGDGLVVEQTHRPEWTYFLPVTLADRQLRLIAIWAYNHRAARFGPQSVGAPLPVLRELGPWLSQGRSIVAGDFNNSIVWDTASGIGGFAAIDAFLTSVGLSSAYHAEGTQPLLGKESNHTYFHTKKADKGYHIDYCYIHNSLRVNALFVGTFDEWRRNSDHVPITVDVDIR